MGNEKAIQHVPVNAVSMPFMSAQENAPVFVKKIGKTTYRVRIHFCATSSETMSDKIKRILRNKVIRM